MKATPTWAPANRKKLGRVGVTRRRAKALREGQRQHGPRQVGKSRGVLAWLGEGQRLCGKVDANMGAGRLEKPRACWRGSAKDKGFARRATPTWAPAGREKPGRVGVNRRRAKTLREGRRQHWRRQVGKSRGVLAWLDEEQRLCGEVGANKDADRLEKPRACWRDSTKGKGFAGRSTPTLAPANQKKLGRVGVARRRIKALRRGRRQHWHRQTGKSRGVLA